MLTRHEIYKKLTKELEMKSLFLKREDLHPYGSHKGRSIPFMIDSYIEQGIKKFAISSSGNAALAAAYYIEKINQQGNEENNNNNKINKNRYEIKRYNLSNNQINKKEIKIKDKITLDILVGQHISIKKLHKLEQFKNQYISITMHDRPLQALFTKTKDPNIKALRQSTDDLALTGYNSLAEELLEIPDLQAVFIGTSSGTTAQALAQYFNSKNKRVEMHIIQTSSCHPMADAFVDNENFDEQSIADAIVDHTALRKDNLIKLIEKSGGSAWIASNEQIKNAQEITKKNSGLDISTNSALSIAGLMQAVYTGKTWNGSVVCMICGD